MDFPEVPNNIIADIPKLYSAVLADVMDRMDLWHQVMRFDIRPLEREMKIFGRARTALAVEVHYVPKEIYKLEMQAVDGLQAGDVLVVTQNGSTRASFWGELLSNAAMARGAKGIVIDGFTRDAEEIMKLGFPVFTKGFTPADSRGRIDVIALDVAIECGGITVNPGDYIFADYDGVVAIPKDKVIEVLTKALEKVKGETTVREELRAGVSVTDVFRKYGIL